MRRRKTSDSNLFAIDYDAIVTTLAEANAPLLKRRADLLAAFSRAPDPLALDDDIVRARRFAGQLDEAIRAARRARSADGRPFRDASATVKAFFDEIDKPLKQALQAILKRLTDAAHRGRARQIEAPEPVPVGMNLTGKTIATADASQPPQSAAPHADIRLVWSIEGFDRQALDLEALRGYLTDASILAACRKHLAEHGPEKLAGAVYREVAQPK